MITASEMRKSSNLSEEKYVEDKLLHALDYPATDSCMFNTLSKETISKLEENGFTVEYIGDNTRCVGDLHYNYVVTWDRNLLYTDDVKLTRRYNTAIAQHNLNYKLTVDNIKIYEHSCYGRYKILVLPWLSIRPNIIQYENFTIAFLDKNTLEIELTSNLENIDLGIEINI